MSIEETRRLGIEFERRVQTMIPEKEYLDKLDTETIYSFLNQYQDKYIHDIYRNLDRIESGSKMSAHIESILQNLLTAQNLTDPIEGTNDIHIGNNATIVDTARSKTYLLDENFYMYIRSVSQVSSTFSYKGREGAPQDIKVLPNQLVSQSEVWKLIETPHDSLRILRYPAAVLNLQKDNKPTLTIIHDRYTTVEGVRVLYYRQPAHFDLMTSTPCELPLDAFDDIVTGAVDLYVQYVAGAEANKRRQDEAARQQAKQNRKNEEAD